MQSAPPPSPKAQLAFLTKLQRLFSEGDFTATYKFALLVALADMSVECGADDGRELLLSKRQIADRFVELYWRQSAPYGTGRLGSSVGILVQNGGSQAAVVKAISEFRARFNVASAQAARTLTAPYNALLAAVTKTVSAQPIECLQNLANATEEFLYRDEKNGWIRLKSGVAYCLRRFQPLVQQLARAHWVDHVKRNRMNQPILGDADDLEAFLFETPRQSLALLAVGLRKLDGDKCFYCGGRTTVADVDHFIPFSQYPRDLAHNFVLAHPRCNRSKSDTLAAKPHLERWLQRLMSRADDLVQIGLEAGMGADSEISRQVAAWGYTNAHSSGGRAWVAAERYEVVDETYLVRF